MSSIGIRSLAMLYDLLHPGTEAEKKEIYAGVRAGAYKAPHLKLLKPQIMHFLGIRVVRIGHASES